MGRVDTRRANDRREDILDAASDYNSVDDSYYRGDTMSPGELEYYQESPGPGESTVLSSVLSPSYDEAQYKSRSRKPPTPKDCKARPGTRSCVCELCDCGKHACPLHGSVPPKKGAKSAPNLAKSRFEGQASYARDYVPPPLEAFAGAFETQQSKREPESPAGRVPTGRGGRPPFEGTSAYKRDYVPPPMEARRQAPADQGGPKPTGRRPPFEGQSMSKRDFVAPPDEAYRQQKASTKTRLPTESTGKRPPFEGQAMYKRDYVPPPREAYNQSKEDKAKPPQPGSLRARPMFDGQAASKRDYVAPPSEAYMKRSASAPAEKPKQRGARFDGDSQSRRDFVPPPREAYYQNTGQTSTDRAKKAAPSSRFQGESMARSHYTAPPKEAYRAAMGDSGGQRCRASILMADNYPPTPGSGREHVYWDPSSKRWC